MAQTPPPPHPQSPFSRILTSPPKQIRHSTVEPRAERCTAKQSNGGVTRPRPCPCADVYRYTAIVNKYSDMSLRSVADAVQDFDMNEFSFMVIVNAKEREVRVRLVGLGPVCAVRRRVSAQGIPGAVPPSVRWSVSRACTCQPVGRSRVRRSHSFGGLKDLHGYALGRAFAPLYHPRGFS